MKILFLAHSFPPFHWRGTEVYAWELATAMAAHHQPHVFHLVDDPAAVEPKLEETEFRGLPVHRVRMRLTPAQPENYFFNPAQEKLFADLLNRLRPDVVHFIYFAGGLSLEIPRLAREGGAKTIISVTDFAGICPRAQLTDREGRACPGPRAGLRCGWCLFGHAFLEGHSRVDRLLRENLPTSLADLAPTPGVRLVRRRLTAAKDAFDRADLVVYPNDNCARIYRSAGFDQPARVIDYGIDLRPYAGHEKTPSDLPRIGFIGQLLPHKGLGVLAESLMGLPDRFLLVIYGNLEDPGARDYVASLKLPDRAEFRGTFPFESMNAVLSEIDVLVVPSRWMENCPLIVKYGIATRTWTVVADQPGMIADRSNPALIFFRPGDPGDLRRALFQAIALAYGGQRPAESKAVTDIADQARFFTGVYEARP